SAFDSSDPRMDLNRIPHTDPVEIYRYRDGLYAVDLLTPQVFPPDATFEPYDDVSWSLPVHYGREAKRIDDVKIKDVVLEALKPGFGIQGNVSGAGPVYLLKDTGQEGLLALRARLAAFKVEIAEKAFKSGDKDYPAGSWIMADQKGLADAVKRAAAELSLDFDSAAAVPDVAHHESKVPRLAVWHSWADTEAVGWVRFVLDREKVPYAYIRDEDVRAGRLKDRYDVIVFAHNYLDLQDQILGIDKKWGPLAYKKTKETPNLGIPDASDDITGGIGWAGMARLEEYLNAGGVLVTLGNGSAIALQGGLVRDVFRRGGSVFTPGSELKVKFTRPDHPLAYGFPEVTSVFRSMLPVYDIGRSERGAVVLQWGTKLRAEDREEEKPDAAKATDAAAGATDTKGQVAPGAPAKKEEVKMLVSGAIKGDDELEGRPAILDLPAGKGRVIAFLFNPIHRDFNRSDHRFLWNALLNWEKIGVGPQL
ncbi:MAG: hypothetical protein ACXWGZ_12080, partial [Candidatus Aminicenantales bacterium]